MLPFSDRSVGPKRAPMRFSGRSDRDTERLDDAAVAGFAAFDRVAHRSKRIGQHTRVAANVAEGRAREAGQLVAPAVSCGRIGRERDGDAHVGVAVVRDPVA